MHATTYEVEICSAVQSQGLYEVQLMDFIPKFSEVVPPLFRGVESVTIIILLIHDCPDQVTASSQHQA